MAAAADHDFDAMLTIDKNIKREHNLNFLPITVFVLMAQTNRLEDLLPFATAIEHAATSTPPRTLVELYPR